MQIVSNFKHLKMNFVTLNAPKADYQLKVTSKDESQYDMLSNQN